MKKTITAVCGMMLLGGCAMKEFSSTPLYRGHEVKFTGRVEDRVNLWPLAYYREPVGSIAWPLVSWGDDHLAFRPIYSQYKQRGSGDYDEFNLLWPFGQFDTRHDDYRFFPFFWGEGRGDEPYFCLFPLLWWNRDFAGVLPFLWSRDDNDMGFAVFPLFWSEVKPSGRLWNTLFPLYYYQSYEERSRDKGERIIASDSKFWALCGLAGYNRVNGKFANHRFLPFYFCKDGDFYSLPFARYRSSGMINSRILLGLAGRNSSSGGEYLKSWLFPLYSHDRNELVTPLFGYSGDSSWCIPFFYRDKTKFLTPLGGKDGAANWIVPLFWRDETTFASLPYWRKLGNDGEIDHAFSFPLLSGYERDDKTGNRLLYLLMGLGGHVWNDKTGGAGWLFPFYYRDRESFYTLLYGRNPRRSWLFPVYFDGEERTYITPLYGRNKKDGSSWLFPLYYRDKESFVTPLCGKSGSTSWLLPIYTKSDEGLNTIPFSYWDDAKKGTRGFFSLPLLSGASWATNSRSHTWIALAGFVGGGSDATGLRKKQWTIPLYCRDKDSFYSIPYSYDGGGASTNVYLAAGLAGIRSGARKGGWLFPIFNYKKDADFEDKMAWMNAPKLPDEVKIWTETVTNWVWNSDARRREDKVKEETRASSFYSFNNKTHLLVSDNDSTFSAFRRYGVSYKRGAASTNLYFMTLDRKIGNRLLFRYTGERSVSFDIGTRERTGDEESGEASLFFFLYNYEHRADRFKSTSYTSHRVLWRLWHWEEENGDVSLDVFPGFTYDSKKNGYSKTSFLWRFFRYENDPEQGKKIDLFFIPVWR